MRRSKYSQGRRKGFALGGGGGELEPNRQPLNPQGYRTLPGGEPLNKKCRKLSKIQNELVKIRVFALISRFFASENAQEFENA